MNYVIIVNDGGEMKTVTASQIAEWAMQRTGRHARKAVRLEQVLDSALNEILDQMAIDAPISVTISRLR